MEQHVVQHPFLFFFSFCIKLTMNLPTKKTSRSAAFCRLELQQKSLCKNLCRCHWEEKHLLRARINSDSQICPHQCAQFIYSTLQILQIPLFQHPDMPSTTHRGAQQFTLKSSAIYGTVNHSELDVKRLVSSDHCSWTWQGWRSIELMML